MKYKEGYRYHLQEDEDYYVKIFPINEINTDWYSLTPLGKLTLKKGFAWDGSSGRFTVQTPFCKRASGIHDALCLMVQYNHLPPHWKENIDREYYNYCVLDGMPRPWALIRHTFISVYHWEKHGPKPVLYAPRYGKEKINERS